MAKINFFLMLLATLAVAQNLTGEPECAVECLRTAIKASSCDPDDQGCQCTVEGKASIQSLSTQCLLKACSLTELITAQQVGNDLCVAYSSSADGASSTTTSRLPSSTRNTGLPSQTGVFVAPTISSGLANATSDTTDLLGMSTSVSVTTTTRVIQTNSTVTSAAVASSSSVSTGAAMPTAVGNFAVVLGGFAVLLL